MIGIENYVTPSTFRLTFPCRMKEEEKQAMITLLVMAEHSFSNVYNYQCLTKVLYLFTWILTFPLIPLPSYLLSSFIIENY